MGNGMGTKRGWWVSTVVGVAFAGLAGLAAAAPESGAEADPMAKLAWQQGPRVFHLGTQGTIKLPEKTAALNEAESNKFLQLTGNLPTEGLQIIAGGDWWATFEFDDAGHVKDDEKIDAEALLKQMKESDGPSNEARRKAGLDELYTEGWAVPPHYDSSSKRLEWGLKLRSPQDPTPTINYTVRVLGRSGYERVVLVSSPDTLDRDVADFKRVLANFEFNDGHKYNEWKQGDRVAEFGLAALVAGGAAAVATKTGFWKVLAGLFAAGWKFIAAGAVFAIAGIGKLFGRKKP